MANPLQAPPLLCSSQLILPSSLIYSKKYALKGVSILPVEQSFLNLSNIKFEKPVKPKPELNTTVASRDLGRVV